MSGTPLEKEEYRKIIETYFRSFGSGDFSAVKFSSNIEFLSPISGLTMKGRADVTKFVSGVSTRVAKVNVLSIAVDYPVASGVWQMETTKGVTYTLHNFFRLDGEGLVYIWPMFDPKAVMADPPGLLQWLRGEGYYPIVAKTGKQPNGVAISKTGRIFVNFPRWIDYPWPSVGEVAADGSIKPYPNESINQWDGVPGGSAREHFVCVHTLYVDSDDKLWILDPASPGQKGVVAGAAKLLRINLASNTVERVYFFDSTVAPEKSYLNKVRFAAGHAFISDSNLGAIVCLNLDTGQARRVLEGHYSTQTEAVSQITIDGVPYAFSPVHVDGVAIDPSLEYLYYKALTGSTLYRIPIKALVDLGLPPDKLASLVEQVAVTEPSGGIEFDSKGNLYITGVEESAIKVLRPNGKLEYFARAVDFLWPDTIAIGPNGDLIFAASQLHLMPSHNNGIDKRTPPFKIFRLSIPGTAGSYP